MSDAERDARLAYRAHVHSDRCWDHSGRICRQDEDLDLVAALAELRDLRARALTAKDKETRRRASDVLLRLMGDDA